MKGAWALLAVSLAVIALHTEASPPPPEYVHEASHDFLSLLVPVQNQLMRAWAKKSQGTYLAKLIRNREREALASLFNNGRHELLSEQKPESLCPKGFDFWAWNGGSAMTSYDWPPGEDETRTDRKGYWCRLHGRPSILMISLSASLTENDVELEVRGDLSAAEEIEPPLVRTGYLADVAAQLCSTHEPKDAARPWQMCSLGFSRVERLFARVASGLDPLDPTLKEFPMNQDYLENFFEGSDVAHNRKLYERTQLTQRRLGATEYVLRNNDWVRLYPRMWKAARDRREHADFRSALF